MSQVTKEIKKAKKQIKEAFDPNVVNFTSNLKREITGISSNFKKMTGKKTDLGNAIEIKAYNDKLKETVKLSKQVKDNTSNVGFVKYDSNKIQEYIDNFGKSDKKSDNIQNITPKTEVEPSQNSLSMWEILKNKIAQAKTLVSQYMQSFKNGNSSKELELVKYKISEIEEKLEKAKNGEIKLSTKDIIKAEAELEKLNNKKAKLENGGKQNIFSGMFSSLKKMTPQLNGMSKIVIKIKNQIKQIGTNTKQGLVHILKYATALFSLRTIYSTLSSSASSWLSSQNTLAQQLSANIEYMKFAMR